MSHMAFMAWQYMHTEIPYCFARRVEQQQTIFTSIVNMY